MRRELTFLIFLVLVLELVGNASAVDVYWDDGDLANHLWSSPNNWDPDGLPTSSDDVYIDYPAEAGISGPIIDANILLVDPCGAQANTLIIGYHNTGTVTMTGGALTTYWTDIGGDHYDEGTGTGVFSMEGGIFNCTQNLQVGNAGDGTLHVTGGLINACPTGTFYIHRYNGDGNDIGDGHVQLDGGTISILGNRIKFRCWKGVRMALTNGSMDITEGTLVGTSGSVSATIENRVVDGTITAYGCNSGDIEPISGLRAFVDFDYDANPGWVTVTTSLVDANCAYNPSPSDGATNVEMTRIPTLIWSPGECIQDVNGHDVYFGTDFNDVNDADTDSNEYMGRQDANTYDTNSYDPCGLELDKTYYWRIDEVNDARPDSPWKGKAWRFTAKTLVESAETVRRILAWNIEHLGIRELPRTQEQINAIAQRILTFDAAVLALQEIYDVSVLEDIRSQLGSSWQIYYSGIENALLYDKNEVEMLSAEILNNLANPPYTSYPNTGHEPVSGVFRPVRMYAESFRIIGVHCHAGDADIRTEEGIWLRTKIVELLEDPNEPNDIILIGDLNGGPAFPPHPSLQEGDVLHLLPKENGNSTFVSGIQIDHCYVTQVTKDKLPKQSTFVIRPEHYGETSVQFEETYSDHYPIFIDFMPDAHTDLVDFAMFAAHWLETGCNLQNNWCGRADLNSDGGVNFNDLKKLVDNWLEGKY